MKKEKYQRFEKMNSVSHTRICSEDKNHLDTPHANSLKEILHDIFRNLPVQKNKVREQTYAAQLPSRNLWCETIKVQKRYMNILFPYLFNFIPYYS